MANLTQEEQALLDSVENGEWQSKPNFEQRKKELQRYAQHHLNAKTHLDITLSLNDFEVLKSTASKQGVSYQIFAENILHQYIENNLLHS
jgi:predicted DNA binding CopG/RHH family protein